MKEIAVPLYVLISGGFLLLALGVVLGVALKEYLGMKPPEDGDKGERPGPGGADEHDLPAGPDFGCGGSWWPCL